MGQIAASIFDHPAVLLLIVFAALVRWLASKAKSPGERPQTPQASQTSAPPTRAIPRGGEAQTEEERVRRFLEALGQPPGTMPPKVVVRRREMQPKIFPRLPTLKTAPPPLPPVTRASKPPPMPIEVVTQPVPTTLQPDFEVHEVARQTSSEPLPESRAIDGFAGRVKLGTAQDLRTAIVLREILGPPRSLQPFDSAF